LATLSNSFRRTPQVVNDWYFFTKSGLTGASLGSVKSLNSLDGGAVTFTFDGANGAGRCGVRGTVPVSAGDQGELHLRPCRARRLACPGISGITKPGKQ